MPVYVAYLCIYVPLCIKTLLLSRCLPQGLLASGWRVQRTDALGFCVFFVYGCCGFSYTIKIFVHKRSKSTVMNMFHINADKKCKIRINTRTKSLSYFKVKNYYCTLFS